MISWGQSTICWDEGWFITGRWARKSWSDPKVSHSINDLLPKESLRPNQQEPQREHVSEPDLDAAADQGADVDLGELFADADDQPAQDGAGDRGEPTEDDYGQRAKGH